jgi:D-lactate dehydrogenase
LDKEVLTRLSQSGTKIVALRCAGFNNVDLNSAGELGITVVRVPAYSPESVAEHTVGLMLALNRKIHRAFARVREGNFALEGLLGFDMCGKIAGIIGTGQIGSAVARILKGFGCEILASDPHPNPECTRSGVKYVPLRELAALSDIITLHCPLTPETYHLINSDLLELTKKGLMLINTGRGALIDTRAVIQGLKKETIGYLGLDVYEEESELFFEDLSETVIQDDVFARLLTFPNVLITGHQGFFTREALQSIVEKFGRNMLPEKKRIRLWVRFLRQFQSPLIYILLFALVVDLRDLDHRRRERRSGRINRHRFDSAD